MKKLIFIFTIVISGMLMMAQTLDEYKQDIVWLKSGGPIWDSLCRFCNQAW